MPKFNPSGSLNFQRPNWPEWKARFERYRIATKLQNKEGDVQVSTLIYSMGIGAENIFKSFHFEGEERKDDFNTVLQKYEDCFIPKRNIIFERSVFHQRKQHDNECVEEFIRVIYELSENCEFMDRDNVQIRDKLVIRLLDKDVCEKLQLKTDLTLEKAKEIALYHELIKKQIEGASAKLAVLVHYSSFYYFCFSNYAFMIVIIGITFTSSYIIIHINFI